MYEIQTLNKISKVGLAEFTADYHCADEQAAPDAILVRSAAMHDMVLPESLLTVARVPVMTIRSGAAASAARMPASSTPRICASG